MVTMNPRCSGFKQDFSARLWAVIEWDPVARQACTGLSDRSPPAGSFREYPGFVERGELGIRLSGLTSCYPPVPGILWFGPRRSHSSVPTRALTRLPRAMAVQGRPLPAAARRACPRRPRAGGRLVGVAIGCMMPGFVVNLRGIRSMSDGVADCRSLR